jgi:hypothetical protein
LTCTLQDTNVSFRPQFSVYSSVAGSVGRKSGRDVHILGLVDSLGAKLLASDPRIIAMRLREKRLDGFVGCGCGCVPGAGELGRA